MTEWAIPAPALFGVCQAAILDLLRVIAEYDKMPQMHLRWVAWLQCLMERRVLLLNSAQKHSWWSADNVDAIALSIFVQLLACASVQDPCAADEEEFWLDVHHDVWLSCERFLGYIRVCPTCNNLRAMHLRRCEYCGAEPITERHNTTQLAPRSAHKPTLSS